MTKQRFQECHVLRKCWEHQKCCQLVIAVIMFPENVGRLVGSPGSPGPVPGFRFREVLAACLAEHQLQPRVRCQDTIIFMGALQTNETSEYSYGLCLKMKDLPLKMGG